MKLTKQIKNELTKAYQCAMDVSILDMKAPLRYINQYIAENVSGYGTAVDEKVSSRADYKKMILDARQQTKGIPFKARLITPYRPKFVDDTTVQFRDEAVVHIGDKKNKHSLHLWFSTLFKYQQGKWQMVLFHGSIPDASSSSADTFHITEAEKKLKQLEQVVAQRTADLQTKTRELEIEASLERVRAVAMGMSKPGDILNICEVFFNELQSLGFTGLRNTLINFWDDENDQLHDYDYSDFAGGNFAKLAYNSHPAFSAFQKKIRKAKDAFAKLVIEKDGLKSWQQRRRKSGEYKDPRLNKIAALYYYFYSTGVGALGISTFSPISKDEVEILKRFRNVFDMAYQRYVDIQKSAAQAREVEIELALERVRSRSMAMQKSEELKEVIQVVYEQFVGLNIPVKHTGFVLDYKNRNDHNIWIADHLGSPSNVTIPYFDSIYYNRFNEAKKKGVDFFAVNLSLKEKNKFYRDLFKHLPGFPEASKQLIIKQPALTISTVLLENIALYMENFSGTPFTAEEDSILMRFGKAFQQAFIRFLDLQKAEAQTRENEIELALERVRSRTMTMQRSSELREIVAAIYEQLRNVGFTFGAASIVIMDKATGNMDWWIHGFETPYPESYNNSYFEHPFYVAQLNNWKEGKKYAVMEVSGKSKKKYDDYIFSKTDFIRIPAATQKVMKGFQKITFSNAYMQYGALSWSAEPINDYYADILQRFAYVFEQSYTRFLDLQKAEAQAREAEVQLALERVRARTMAMRHSIELSETATELFLQLKKLGAQLWTCGFALCEKDNVLVEKWMGSPITGHLFNRFVIPCTANNGEQSMYDTWKNGVDLYTYIQEGEELRLIYEELMTVPSFRENYKELIESGMAFPTWQKFYIASYKYGYLLIITTALFNEETIFTRFAKVFEQTYTRFLDLQKAEAQAKESEIELALERVRARTMAMQHSNELPEAATILFQQMQTLGMPAWSAGYCIWDDDEKNTVTLWMSSEGVMQPPFSAPTTKDELFIEMRKGQEAEKIFHVVEIGGKKLVKHYKYMRTLPVVGEILDSIINAGHPLPTFQIMHHAYFSKGFLLFITYEPVPESHDIFKRFGRVFDQTYTRFLDLQKAEAQAKEAQIETGLEKVRSRTMAMQSSNELQETAAVLFQEFKKLGTEEIYQVTIGIYNEEEKLIDFRVTDWAGSGQQEQRTFQLDMNEPSLLQPSVAAWKDGKKSAVFDLTGDRLQGWLDYRNKISGITMRSQDTSGRRVISVAYFSKGHLSLSSPLPLSGEKIKTLERFASVFDGTYTRFLDLEKAEAQAFQAEQDLIAIKEAKQKAEDALIELQATQKQLVQSEKMASLGELTAGIAHEIQNPLNFVNNFSEVSKELLDEMKEAIEKGDTEDAKEIMNDVIQNLEKINHHGKRADGIVKGMLQHSRSSSGQKELTDINALCDEYLRLAYHGLRAKDKSFNAKFETSFDEAVGKLSVIPQDIGRVVLNLINNAFYAVSERKKLNEPGYEPTVSLSTLKEGNIINIKVRDNGTGIPQHVVDKIFQPFFTTKPTGQGTGLGLSLSYDIVTKGHGGELKVETVEAEGTEFSILLPG